MNISTGTLKKYLENIEDVVESRNVTNDPYVCFPYGRACGGDMYRGETPYFVVRPGTTEEVQDVVRFCNEWKMPMYVRSMGTQGLGAIPLKKGIVFDMSRMDRLLKIDEGSLSCAFEPAMTFGELESLLDPYGFRMLVYPGVADAALGGNVAHCGFGRGSALFGTMGDCILGLKVVLPDGELITTGNMANPYADSYYERYTVSSDLTGLFIGSEGVMGIITEVGMKIEKYPPAVGYAEYEFNSIEDTAKAVYRSRLERIPTIMMMLTEGVSIDRMYPDKAPHKDSARWIRIEGNSEEAVEVEQAKLESIANDLGGTSLGPEGGMAFWKNKWHAGGLRGQGGYRGMRTNNSWIVPFHDLGGVLKELRRLSNELEEKHGLDVNISATCYSTRCAVAITNVVYNDSDPDERKLALEVTNAFKLPILKMGATPIRIGRYWGDYVNEFGNRFSVLKKLKDAIDPNGIMAPGMWGY